MDLYGYCPRCESQTGDFNDSKLCDTCRENPKTTFPNREDAIRFLKGEGYSVSRPLSQLSYILPREISEGHPRDFPREARRKGKPLPIAALTEQGEIIFRFGNHLPIKRHHLALKEKLIELEEVFYLDAQSA